MALIEMRDVTKTYSLEAVAVHALRRVSLDIEGGEFVAITGPSGSGKSTMMHIMGCLDVPTSGSYRLGDEEVSKLSDDQLARLRSKRLGFVFQQFNLLSRTTALANVELPLLYMGIRDRHGPAQRSLERVGLGDRLHHFSNQLSGGQQQRVAIARALVNNPSIVLADEPTGNLATLQSEEIMALFQELNDSGITVVMVTHEPDIARHAKRVIRFRDGRIVEDSAVPDRIRANDLLVELHRENLEQDDADAPAAGVVPAEAGGASAAPQVMPATDLVAELRKELVDQDDAGAPAAGVVPAEAAAAVPVPEIMPATAPVEELRKEKADL